MELQVESQRIVTVCAGVGSSGKTTFALRYLANQNFACRFIFDPEGEAAQRLQLEPTCDAFDLARHIVRGWVLFHPEKLFGSNFEAAFAFFCEWVFEKSRLFPGQKILMVDEVWKLCPNRTITSELQDCVRTGRKRELETLFNTQTPNQLPDVILNEVSEFVAFRLQSNPALTLAEARGFKREELATLPDLSFVARTDRGGELRGRIKI